MTGDVIDRLAAQFAQPKVLNVDGKDRLLAPLQWTEKEEIVHTPSPLVLPNLAALVAYQASAVGQKDAGLFADKELAYMVEGPTAVSLAGGLEPKQARRRCYAQAVPVLVQAPFGKFLDAESFIIWLQTGFVATPALASLISVVGSIRESAVRETVDDGYAQEVKTGRGVALVGSTTLPNPVTLAPYRTFPEVKQPESLFALRARRGGEDDDRPQLALFEADGGAWRLEAITAVGEWLKANSGGVPVLA